MRIRNHEFPYPVLRDKQDAYLNGRFTVKVSHQQRDGQFVLRLKMECTNTEILELIEQGSAQYAVHVECGTTYFRKLFCSSKQEFERAIPESLLDLQVEICPVIVAMHDIAGFTSDDLDDVYTGETIFFRKGDFLAIGNQSTADILRKQDELKQLSSPFCVLAYPEGEEQKYMRIEPSQNDQIIIYVTKDEHPIIDNVQGNRDRMEEIHAALYFPALMQTIELMRGENGDEHEHKRWYIAINQKAIDKGIGDIRDSQEDAYVIAQKLFDYPMTRWLKTLSSGE